MSVFRDRWGVPHLRADDPGELAFAQGRVTAYDRAWQIEVERHRSVGASAAFLGAEAVPWDRFARQSRLDDTARRCHARLDEATAAWVGRYVDGVNEGLAAGAARDPRFAAAGLAPGRWEPWTPLAIWLTHHVLFAGFPGKLWREHVARRLSPDAVTLFHADGPAGSGSNGWLLAGSRTATGTALIAGDPHRYIEDPGIYQQIRLACPEYDAVGLAVPGVPGIAHFGHTGAVAWAITNAMADYQDLYAERLRRTETGVEAYGPDGWRPVRTHTETITVAGGDPVEVEVVETDRGPVVIGGPDEAEPVSLRYPPRVTGELGFAALPALLRARTVADVDAAVDHWVEPVNVVLAADTAGGLLHRVAGVVPVRHPDNGLRVVPAWETAYAWRGWHPMPRAAVGDVAVMANDRAVSAPLGVEFAPPHRARRIRQLLDGGDGWTAARMGEVHTDTYSAAAEPLLALLADLDRLPAEAAALRDRLLHWDRRMAGGSGDAGAFAAVRAALVRRVAAHPALAALADPPAYPEVFVPWLALTPRVATALGALLAPGALPGLDAPALARQALLEVAGSALDPAVGGADARWGARHRLAPWRAVPAGATAGAGTAAEAGPGTGHEAEADPGVPAGTGPGGEVGPEPPVGPDVGAAGGPELDGDHDCVLATSSVPGVTDLCLRGPAARYAWDLARRDDSRWVVPLGADGVPGAAHHDDQFASWRRGELLPVVTDWAELTEEWD